ncbi:MAG: universal stress protein [Candidatus Eremiobacterota bacterium]
MKVLICTDGSPSAEMALKMGGLVAGALKADTTLLGISETPSDQPALLEVLTRAQDYLREHHGLEASLLAKQGIPVERIVDATRYTPYDLVVVGGARRGPARLRPEKIYPLLKRVHSRLLVVGDHAHPEIKKILLCSGGSVYSERAVRFAGELARALGAQITFFHVMAAPPAIFESLENEENPEVVMSTSSTLGRVVKHQKDLLEAMGVEHRILLVYGLVLEEIRAELERGGYDLVVAGSRPEGGGFLLDDVAQEILQHLDGSILVVRTRFGRRESLWGRLRKWLGRK